MAHLAPDAAIFSPSVARLAASTAKDWSYVDGWLAAKYRGRSPPTFERNTDTLRALLALATLNENADENRDLVARVEADAARDLEAAGAKPEAEAEAEDENGVHGNDRSPASLDAFKALCFASLEDGLTKEGRVSLDAMAAAVVGLSIASPEPAQLGQAMLDLQTRSFDLEQATARVGILQRYINSETARLDNLLEEVSADTFRPSADLARQNLEMQRKVKATTKKLSDLKDKVSSLARATGVPNPTIEQVRQEEQRYLELLEAKRTLDQQINEFDGLPPDTEQARQQLDALRKELRSINDRRDAVFEHLVERETPRKAR